jgi:hypothetical protein
MKRLRKNPELDHNRAPSGGVAAGISFWAMPLLSGGAGASPSRPEGDPLPKCAKKTGNILIFERWEPQ